MASQWFILLAIISLVRLGATGPIYSSDGDHVSWLNIPNTNDNLYQNSFFDLSIEKPAEWYAMSSKQLQTLFQNVAIPMLSSNNDSMNELVQTSAQSLIPLFGFTQYPFGQPNGQFNPNIIGLVQNMTGQAKIENDCDTFTYSNRLLQSTPMKVVFNSDCREVELDGKKFAMQELAMKAFSIGIINQTQYVTSARKNYFFTFTLAYVDEVSKNALNNIIKTLKFSV